MSLKFHFSARLRSFRFAGKGILILVKTQHNAWIHAGATSMVCLAGWYVGLKQWEWCMIVGAIMAVWVAEAFNTGLEFLADATSPQYHPLVEKAKDTAAGAVLLAAMGAVAIGILIFWPYFFSG